MSLEDGDLIFQLLNGIYFLISTNSSQEAIQLLFKNGIIDQIFKVLPTLSFGNIVVLCLKLFGLVTAGDQVQVQVNI